MTGVLSEVTGQENFPYIDKMVLSLRQTYPELQENVKRAEEYQKSNNVIGPTVKLNPPASIPEAKRKIENHFRNKTKMKEVVVLGPYEDESAEIKRLLRDTSVEAGSVHHYFVYGPMNDTSKIEIIDLPESGKPGMQLNSEIAKWHIIFSKNEFTEFHFKNYPSDSFFFPTDPDLPSEEAIAVAQRIVDGIRKADLLENESLDQILSEQESYHKVMSSASLLSKTDIPLLITGDSRAYRHKIGKMIHCKSNYHKGKFVLFDCKILRNKHYEWFNDKFFRYFFLKQIPEEVATSDSSVAANKEVSDEMFKKAFNDIFRLEEGLDIDHVNEWTIFFDRISFLDESRISELLNFLKEDISASDIQKKKRVRLLFGLRNIKGLRKAYGDMELDEFTAVNLNVPSFNDFQIDIMIRLLRAILDKMNEVLLNCQSNSIFSLFKLELSDSGLKEMTNYLWPRGFEQICEFFKSFLMEYFIKHPNPIGGIGVDNYSSTNDGYIGSYLSDWQGIGGIRQAERIQVSEIEGIHICKYRHLYEVDAGAVTDLPTMLDEIEREYILDAIKKFGSSQAKVAFSLGYSQPMISRKIARYKLLNLYK
jgi:hypothetical protein